MSHWNVNPEDRTTYLRLISELEGSLYLLSQLPNTEEEVAFLETMKKKYYRLYFKSK